MLRYRTALYLFFCFFYQTAFSQTLPVGTPILEDYWRQAQISGTRDLHTSFMIRPIAAYDLNSLDSMYNAGNFSNGKTVPFQARFGSKGNFRLLPAFITQQYNSHHPYGWNDGPLIPARGYQVKATAGVYASFGPLSLQLAPEFVYAQNRNFDDFPHNYSDSIWGSYYRNILNSIDAPEKFGQKAYVKVFPGQSSLKLNIKKVSIGLSTENLWWGPGMRNSLIMSNNAPGFPHLTFNSNQPVGSAIGFFEWQVIAGRLKSSGIIPPDTSRTLDGQRLYIPKPNDDRYLNGMVITWQPKWTPNLYLGLTRVFNQYNEDVGKSFDGIFPVLGTLFKGQTNDEDAKNRDQLLSFFARLVMPKEKAEVYAEFGRNDHAQNARDFALEPEHSRAFIIGARKLFSTLKKSDLEVAVEFTDLSTPATSQIRPIPTWYSHAQVMHGYTNRGQVIGAGIGPGSSSQTLSLSWIKGIKRTKLSFERVVRNNDFYYQTFSSSQNFGSHWVDLSVNLNRNWVYDRFLFSANLSFIRSLNYQWRHEFDSAGDPVNRNVTSLQAGLSVGYIF